MGVRIGSLKAQRLFSIKVSHRFSPISKKKYSKIDSEIERWQIHFRFTLFNPNEVPDAFTEIISIASCNNKSMNFSEYIYKNVLLILMLILSQNYGLVNQAKVLDQQAELK